MKNILFVDHHAELSGGEIALLEIIKNLDRDIFFPLVILGNNGPLEDEFKKINVDVIIYKLPGYLRRLERDPAQKTRPIAFIKSALYLPNFIKKLKLLIVEKNIDIVYINSIKSSLYAMIAARQTRRKTIWHLHDCLNKNFYPPWIIPLIISLTNLADKIICVSNVVKEYFVKAGGDGKKATVIYNGVDIGRFAPDISKEIAKKELKFSSKKIVSMVSRLEPWKGQDIFIKIAKVICDMRGDIIFLIVGAPLFGFNEYEKKLNAMVKQLGLTDKIFFLGFRTDPERIYAASDVVVHCSTKPEPFGRDVIEAMSCCRPVVAIVSGAMPEIITDKKDGILVQSNDPKNFAYEILKLIDNSQTSEILSRNARKKIEELFNIVKISKKIEQLLME